MNWILVNNLIKKFDNKKEFKKYLIDTVDIYSNSDNYWHSLDIFPESNKIIIRTYKILNNQTCITDKSFSMN